MKTLWQSPAEVVGSSSHLDEVVFSDAEGEELHHVASADAHSIALLVEAGPASVRLRNVVTRGVADDRMPFLTVGEYLAAGRTARQRLMQALRSCGRGTANELDALVQKFVRQNRIDPALIDQDPVPLIIADPSQQHVDQLISRLGGVTFGDALFGRNPSARLVNSLNRSGLAELSITNLLFGVPSARGELLRIPNFGRKSFAELETFVQLITIRTLAKHCTDPMILVDDCALLFGIEESQKHALAQIILETLTDTPPCQDDFESLLNWAMQELHERELAVIRRRFGFDTGEIETLEEIGPTYDVTRERIRQIEAKALRKLRARLAGTGFLTAIEASAEKFWELRSPPYLLMSEVDDLRRALPAPYACALAVANLNARTWLERASVRLRHGYAAHRFDCAGLKALAERFNDIGGAQALPVAVSDIFPGEDPAFVGATAALGTNFCEFEGYLLRERPRARLKRTIRLHQLLASAGRIMGLYEIAAAYSRFRCEDDCSLRDLVIVMEDARHLFVEIEDGLLWRGVGSGMPPLLPLCPKPWNGARSCAPATADPMTIAGALQEALVLRGPTSVGELYRDGEDVLPEGRVPGGIPFTLGGRPEIFHRILPGVYALPGQAPDDDAIATGVPLRYLLNEAQARSYAFARKAGEAWGTYPLWTPASEYRLCDWAQFKAPPALYHSLLAIADVDAWPVDERERIEWRRRAELKGRFEIVLRDRELLDEARPELDRLLAACLVASERGSINWLAINRIMSRRLDAAGGQGLLALLVGLGCVDPPEAASGMGVMLAHRATPRAAELARELGSELLRSGELDWDSPLGQRLVVETFQRSPDQMGWVPLDRLEALFGEDHLPGVMAQTAPEELDEDDLIARLMREHRRDSEIARRNALAAGLLDD